MKRLVKVSVDPNSEDLNHPRYTYSISLRSSKLSIHSQTVNMSRIARLVSVG